MFAKFFIDRPVFATVLSLLGGLLPSLTGGLVSVARAEPAMPSSGKGPIPSMSNGLSMMSRTTMSGRRSTTLVTASRPVRASAQMTQPACPSRTVRTPCRTIS